ncbi:uncharacterized protein LOC131996048 [Stomoxys calcitrans]|uniref:uncharacterized protein LOC131996048 n=1 Tax=Stomoxys calcitrans TaxID=35570 RepID=UPI0027E2C8FB|nr:uncharacterized protein LOC131996048 [Stomoxys calcitrans]
MLGMLCVYHHGAILQPIIYVSSLFKLYAVKFWLRTARCTTHDPEFSKFDLCQLAPDNANVPRLSVVLRLLKGPITSCKTGVTIGYATIQSMPLIVNTWDFCAFMADSKRFKSFERIFEYFGPYSNINHTCPYDHDIYVTNFTLTRRAIMPLPNGRYAINTTYIFNKKSQISANITFDFEN